MTNDNHTDDIGYAGDLPPSEAWSLLESNASAILVDVRTKAEWAFIGVSDLSALGKEVLFVEWQKFPDLAHNAGFADELRSGLSNLGANTDTPLLFICRSGHRSKMAAMEMTKQGFKSCFNIAEGFEGDLNNERQRGKVGGWKVAGLPWAQQ